MLPEFGATELNARIVRDGNITTGASVSAGLDFALALLAQVRGEPYAKAIKLQADSAPETPLQAGTLESIDPSLGEPIHELFATALFAMKEASKK